MMKRLVIALCALAFALGVGAACAAESPLTLLVYMAGSDLESQAGAASDDLDEMAAAMPAEGLSVAVLTGGALQWRDGTPAEQNVLWRMTPRGAEEVERYPGDNMGDPATLSAFLKRGTELFPAERYALVLWDHGAGPLVGVCFDERYHSDGLGLDELTAALADSPFAEAPLAFIGFDACLMATAEVADAVAPYAAYMIASQEPEPTSGWSYAFLEGLPDAEDGGAAGRLIVDAYAESQRDTLTPVTLSCVRLSAMAALRREIDAVFGGLEADMGAALYAKLAACRSDTKAVGAATTGEWDLADLMDLAEMLESEGLADTAALRAALGDAVVCAYANEPYVCGLSIYSPFGNKAKYTYPWSLRYDTLSFSPAYRSYVHAFADQWMEESRVDWRDAAATQAEADAQRERLSVRLTEEEAADVASARLLVLERCGDMEEYRLLYAVDGLKPENGELSAVYHNEALYVLDDDGNVIDGPLVWRPLNGGATASGDRRAEGGIATYGLLENDRWEFQAMYVTWMPDAEGVCRFAELYVWNEDLDMYTVSAIPLQKGECLMLGGYDRLLPESGAPYEDWERGEMIVHCDIECEGDANWHVQFLPLQSTDDRIALFEITDLHHNVHLSAPIALENTSALSLTDAFPQTREGAGLRLTLDGAQLYTDANAKLELRFSVEGCGAGADAVSVETVLLDDTALLDCYMPWCEDLPADGAAPITLNLYAEDLRKARVGRAERLRVGLSVIKGLDRVDFAWFDFDLPVDLAALAAGFPEAPEPIASFEADGLVLDLLGLRFDADGNLVCDLHMQNRGDGDKRVTQIDGLVNGMPLLPSIPQSGLTPFVLPPGSEGWFAGLFYLYEYGENGKEPVARFSDIAQIERIEFRVTTQGRYVANLTRE